MNTPKMNTFEYFIDWAWSVYTPSF